MDTDIVDMLPEAPRLLERQGIIDTNYSGEAFFISHAYFLGDNKPYEKLQKAPKADIPEDVKVINHYGDEVMKVISI